VFKHIVVGCNGTPESQDAAALGAAIASGTGARLSLLGVFPISLFPLPGNERRTLRAEATRVLRRERHRFAPEAITHTAADSSVPRALRRFAERRHAGLVIIGSSPSAPPGHAAISRRGRQLLQDMPFALCLATRGLHEREAELKAIGVGYDGGPESDIALGLAAELAQATDTKLLVRRVVDDRIPVFAADQWRDVEDLSHDRIWEGAREEALAEAEAAVAGLGIHADVSATLGDPGYELRSFSEMVDMIVVGSRRWGAIARLVSGGVGETLVADAKCSVLIVPRPAAGQRRGERRRGDLKPALA
jgi:nucleotide-binding universal stress UspA family protein